MSGLLLIILCAVGLRLFLTFLPVSHEYLVNYLNDKLNTSFVVEQVDAEWRLGRPSLNLKGLKLQGNNAREPALEIKHLKFELNLRDSLFSLAPVFNQLEADGIFLAVESDNEGVWSLRGIQYIRGDESKAFNVGEYLKGLQRQNYIDLTNLRLELKPYGEEPLELTTYHLSLYEEQGVKKISTSFQPDNGEILIEAQGQGFDRFQSVWSGSVLIENVNPVPWCALSTLCSKTLKGVELNIESDWSYENGDWSLSSDINASNLVIRSSSTSSSPDAVRPTLSVRSQLSVTGDSPEKRWNAQFTDLRVQAGDKKTLSFDVDVSGNQQAEAIYTFDVPILELKPAKEVLLETQLMPELVKGLLEAQNPAGRLNDVAITYYPGRALRKAMDLSAELQDVSVDNWFGVPSVSSVNGRLRMGLLDGQLELDTDQFRLGFVPLFRKVWQFDRTTASLEWDVLEDQNIYQLISDDITIKGEEGDLSGKLRLDIPLDGKPIYMDLDVVMSNVDASYTSKYLPTGLPTFSDELTRWLDKSIKGGKILKGGFIYDGYLQETEDPDDTDWKLYLDLENARFDYDPRWPEVYDAEGKVFVNNDQVTVNIESAKIFNTDLSDVSTEIQLKGKSVININGQFSGQGRDLKKILSETPIDQKLNGAARNWDVQGDIKGSLSLGIPFDDSDNTAVAVAMTTDNGQFAIPSQKLFIDRIKGAIDFSSEKGLSTEQLKGRFLGGNVVASILQEGGEGLGTTLFNWSGSVSSGALQEWIPLDALSFLEGDTNYQGELRLGGKENFLELDITSDLKGMEIELPAPLQLDADETAAMALNLTMPENGQSELRLKLAELINSRIEFRNDFNFASAVVQIGKSSEPLKPLKDGKVVISGNISEFDLLPWKQRFEGQPVDTDERSVFQQINVERLKIGKLIYNQTELDNLELNISDKVSSVSGVSLSGRLIQLSSNTVDGSLLIPEDANKPYELNVKRLYLPKSDPADTESSQELSDFMSSMNPREIPDVEVKIDSLKVGSRDLGGLSFNLQSLPGGKRIGAYKGTLNGLNLSGDADWTYVYDGHRTSYTGALSGSGIEDFQEAIGFSAFVSAQSSKIYTQLSWDGTPTDVNMASLGGTVSLRLKDGKLQKLEGGAGTLKLLGIFNLEALTRRLRLDFSDLFSNGISFDRLEGAVRFDQGIVTFDRPIKIEGPSSDFKLDGMIDTNRNQIDMSLVVSLPLSSNLSILSVLLGSAPQVAGIIYLADKLVGKQVDQLASIRYEIKGSLDNPDVSLDRLFSNKAKKPKVKKKK